MCTDCGSRTPGAGHSSRWHAHYTVCDSCYQQRNKGFFCPLCRRAYRAAAVKEMVQCNICRKAVHSSCDPEAEISTYVQRKKSELNYDYICPVCKQLTSKLKRKNSIEDGDSSLSASQESLMSDEFYNDMDSFSSDKVLQLFSSSEIIIIGLLYVFKKSNNINSSVKQVSVNRYLFYFSQV